MRWTTGVIVTFKAWTHVDVELHVLPLAKTSKFVTEGEKESKKTQMSKLGIYWMWWISSIQSLDLNLHLRLHPRLPRLTSQWTSGRSSLSSCRRSPLCMAAKGERHTNSISGQVSLSERMWVSPLCIVLVDELDLVLLTFRFCLVPPC